MKVTAIIPSLASEATKPYLKLCVESLRATVDWDIIVVTNGKATPPDLKDIKGISRHLHTKSQGQCVAVNYGAQLASPTDDYLFISNDDMFYPYEWNYNIGFEYPVFSPNLIEPVNNAGSAPPFIKFDGGLTLKDFDAGKVNVFSQYEMDKDSTREPGFNLPFFIKKDLWEQFGGYDVAYDPWGSNSDTDLQTRINLAGVMPMRQRSALVYHFSNKSGTFDGTHQDFYQNNIDYFKQKFGFDRDELGSDVWYNKDMLPEDLAKIKLKVEKYEG